MNHPPEEQREYIQRVIMKPVAGGFEIETQDNIDGLRLMAGGQTIWETNEQLPDGTRIVGRFVMRDPVEDAMLTAEYAWLMQSAFELDD